jgi:hypothetical protein
MPRTSLQTWWPSDTHASARSTLALALFVLVGSAAQYAAEVIRSGEVSIVIGAVNLLTLLAAIALVLRLDRTLRRTEQALRQHAQGDHALDLRAGSISDECCESVASATGS